MKGFIIVVAVAIIGVQALTDEEKVAEFLKIHAECLASSGVDVKLIFKALRNEFVDDPKFKELLFCISKKLGLQNEAGQIQMDVMLTKLNEIVENMDNTKKLIAICVVQKETPQQTSFEMAKCIRSALA